MRIVEAFTNAINSTQLNNYFSENYVNSNPSRLSVSIPYGYPQLQQFATGIILTLLNNPNVHFLIKTKQVSTTFYAMTNLNPNGIFEDLTERALNLGYSNKNQFVYKKLTGFPINHYADKNSSRYSINIIEATRGMSNIQRWLDHYGYTSIENNIADKEIGQKVLLYELENTLILITNTASTITETLTRLTGWLPIVFKEIYKDFLIKNTPIYDFFTKCYNNENINYNEIKNLEVIAPLIKEIKTTKIAKTITQLGTSLKKEDEKLLTTQKNSLKDLEQQYIDLLQRINLTEMRIATSAALNNQDLLIKTLTNNPYLDELWIYAESIILRIKNPVDYDKTKFKNVHKQDNTFNKIMTADFLELHWTACCELNFRNFTIRRANDYQDNEYIPNTHWHDYNCFGNNVAPISKALKEKDFLSAFMLSLTAAPLLNIYDMTVVHRLADNLKYSYSETHTFLNKETGKFVTYAEAIQLIKEKEKENGK